MTDDELDQAGKTMNRIIEFHRQRLRKTRLSLIHVRSGFRKTGAAHVLGHTAVTRGCLNLVCD